MPYKTIFKMHAIRGYKIFKAITHLLLCSGPQMWRNKTRTIHSKKKKTLPGVPKLLATSTAIYSFHFEFCGFISLTSEIHLNKSPTFCVLFSAEFFPTSQPASQPPTWQSNSIRSPQLQVAGKWKILCF